MKKILSLLLVALSALGLTATVNANPTTSEIRIDSSTVSSLNYSEVDSQLRSIFEHYNFDYSNGGQFQTSKMINIAEFGIVSNMTIGSTINIDHEYDDGITAIEIWSGGSESDAWIYIDFNNMNVNLDADPGVYFILRATKIEDLRPAISGQETFATKVDEARPVEYFIGFLKAIDDIDGDISDDIYVVTDNYTPNKSVLGTHEVTVGVEDSSGNVSEFTFKVSVVDITAPIINGNSSVVSVGYKETYNIANFKSTLTVTDNYDSLTASDITIKSDTYSTNKSKLGTWNVVFEVADSSGNVSTFTKPIKVIDNVAPVFSGIETLTKSYTEVMTLSDIIAQVTANDEIDGNLTNKITVTNDGFTGKSNKVGTHYIELSVTDNAGNTTTRTITVKVIDDQAAGWYITNGVSINLTPGTELTRTQIVELLHKSGQVLAPANARVTYLTDTYSENIGTPGTYTLAFRTVLTNGQENNYTYAVNVLDNKTDEDTEVLPGVPFYEENKILIWAIGGAALLGAVYFVFKKKKK